MPMKPIRPGELSIALPTTPDAGLHFIARIRTPCPTPARAPGYGQPALTQPANPSAPTASARLGFHVQGTHPCTFPN